MKYICLVLAFLLVLLIAGCAARGQIMDGDGMVRTFEYTSITQDEAKKMMEEADGYVIADVRRADEYAEGHIPGAILIPNESIGNTPPQELPDWDQIILVYCRSGRRSKEAAKKLADLGYSRVYEFGGILDWTGDIVKEEEHSEEDMEPAAILVVRAGERSFTAELAGNESADALMEKLKSEEVSLSMHDYGGFEKVGELPWSLPSCDENLTTKPGDLILYAGNQITVYYGENTWNLTKLGHLNGTEEEIREAFGGKDDLDVTIFLEWTE